MLLLVDVKGLSGGRVESSFHSSGSCCVDDIKGGSGVTTSTQFPLLCSSFLSMMMKLMQQ
jgi:hypothetical protein